MKYKIPEHIVQEAIQPRREPPNRSIPTIIQILELEGKVEPGFLKRTALLDALASAGETKQNNPTDAVRHSPERRNFIARS